VEDAASAVTPGRSARQQHRCDQPSTQVVAAECACCVEWAPRSLGTGSLSSSLRGVGRATRKAQPPGLSGDQFWAFPDDAPGPETRGLVVCGRGRSEV